MSGGGIGFVGGEHSSREIGRKKWKLNVPLDNCATDGFRICGCGCGSACASHRHKGRWVPLIRGAFYSTYDIIQRMTLGRSDEFSNDAVNFSGAKVVLKTKVGDDVSAFASGLLLASQTDDIAPLKYNGTYIGANHR